MPSTPIAVIDFETTGMMPAQGARATELAVVVVERGQVVRRWASLMHTGVWIPPFITQLTGISNAMVAAAPPAAEVMREALRVVDGAPLVAHNAAFDRGFWASELGHAKLAADLPFACTVRLSRRLNPELRSHALGALARHHRLPATGRAHRALADAEMTAALLLRLLADLRQRFGVADADHALLCGLQGCATRQVGPWLARRATPGCQALTNAANAAT